MVRSLIIVWKYLAALLLVASPATAMDWLDAEELESSCRAFLAGSTEKDAVICLAFVQGFLAGAEPVPGAKRPDPDEMREETYAERVTRTRLSTLRLMELRSNQPDYCLDDSLSTIQIVETVAGYLESHQEALSLTNAEAVYEALIHEYPCNREQRNAESQRGQVEQ